MIHRRSPRCVDNLTAEATHVPARAGGYGPIGGGFIKGFSSRHSQSAPRVAWRIWRIPGVKSRSATKPGGRLDSYRSEEKGHVPSDYVGKRAPARQVLAVIGGGRKDIARARRISLGAHLSTLIGGGRIRQDGLAKELLTESEYLMGGRRQGFSSLEEIESRMCDRL